MKRKLALVAVLLIALSLIPDMAPAKEPIVIRFGFYPSHNRDQLTILAKEFCSYMSKRAELQIVPFVSQDYDDLIEGVTQNKVHFAWLSPLSYVKAEKSGNARVMLKSVRGSDPFYWGAIIVRKDSGINSVEDLMGTRMGWAYPSSTAGYIFTKAALHALGINTDTYFISSTFLGGYDTLVKAVLTGQIDAAAVFANDTENRKGAWTEYLGPRERRLIKAIFYTKPIPGDTITGSKIFIEQHPKETHKILKALLEMGDDSEGRELLTDLYNVDYLVDAESADYESVREAHDHFPDRR